MVTYITASFITEALRLVTQVKLLLTTFTVNYCLTQCQLTLIGSVSTMFINVKATPINNIDYSCHITAVELVSPITWYPYHATSHHQLLIAWGWTHTCIHTHPCKCSHKNNFKKLGAHWLLWFKNQPLSICQVSRTKANTVYIVIFKWKIFKNLIDRDFGNDIFENKAGIQLAVIVIQVFQKFSFENTPQF